MVQKLLATPGAQEARRESLGSEGSKSREPCAERQESAGRGMFGRWRRLSREVAPLFQSMGLFLRRKSLHGVMTVQEKKASSDQLLISRDMFLIP